MTRRIAYRQVASEATQALAAIARYLASKESRPNSALGSNCGGAATNRTLFGGRYPSPLAERKLGSLPIEALSNLPTEAVFTH